MAGQVATGYVVPVAVVVEQNVRADRRTVGVLADDEGHCTTKAAVERQDQDQQQWQEEDRRVAKWGSRHGGDRAVVAAGLLQPQRHREARLRKGRANASFRCGAVRRLENRERERERECACVCVCVYMYVCLRWVCCMMYCFRVFTYFGCTNGRRLGGTEEELSW